MKNQGGTWYRYLCNIKQKDETVFLHCFTTPKCVSTEATARRGLITVMITMVIVNLCGQERLSSYASACAFGLCDHLSGAPQA